MVLNYIVIYQILCLTLNTNGEVSNPSTESTMKWDDEKIQRECKWFDIDTIRIAKGLFLQLGLVSLRVMEFKSKTTSRT